MKKLFIVRHAKSSWSNPGLKDFDRPLNDRGNKDAPFMSQFIADKYLAPSLIISSPANRAYTTACHFAEAFGINKDDIQQEKSLYHAYPEEVYEVLHGIDKDVVQVLIFGHNPTFTSIANHFNDEYIDNVPTCGVVYLKCDVEDWGHINRKNTKLKAFYYPKMFNKK